MGIFNRNKKKTSSVGDAEQKNNSVQTQPEANTEEKSKEINLKDKASVDKRLEYIYNKEELYIILTMGPADLEKGYSLPMILLPEENKRLILIFTEYESAVNYVTKLRPMVVDGIMPIAEIKKSDKIHNIDVICANALAMGITEVSFDAGERNGFTCKLQYFMQLNKMPGKGQIVFTKEELEKIKENGGKFTPRFNAMKIMNFTNPYIIYKARAEEVVENVLGEDGVEWARENAEVQELCYAANQLMLRDAKAQRENNEDEKEKYKELVYKINDVIFDKLAKLDTWYTLVNKETGEIYTQANGAYLLYTPRYANRLPAGTEIKAIPPSVAEFAYAIGDAPVNAVVVTDGPKIMHIIERSVFGF
jgi:hypothetical protein